MKCHWCQWCKYDKKCRRLIPPSVNATDVNMRATNTNSIFFQVSICPARWARPRWDPAATRRGWKSPSALTGKHSRNILNILNIIVNIIGSMIVILAYFCHFVSQRCFLREQTNSSVHPSKYRLLRIMMFSSIGLIGSKSLRRIWACLALNGSRNPSLDFFVKSTNDSQLKAKSGFWPQTCRPSKRNDDNDNSIDDYFDDDVFEDKEWWWIRWQWWWW